MLLSVTTLLTLSLAACTVFGRSPASLPPDTLAPGSTPTFTPQPSVTLPPTWTPLPTDTPPPTNTPTPSHTPWPTATLPPTNTPTPTPYRDPLLVAPPLDLNSVLPWDRSRTVTLLLMGIDRRPTQGGRARTDTMLLMRLNPAADSAGVLSIPRDLYVDIPGYGRNRINSAYVFGGGDLARSTVENSLGVQVDYYLVIDFVVFTTLVDEIGGIDIEVPYPINDPTYPDHYYGYDPLYISAGLQHMDGTTALKYARSRHGSSDFERSRRQQQVLFAIRDKVVNLDMLVHLLTRAPGLYAILTGSFDTNLPFEQMVSLALVVGDTPRENIRSSVIDGTCVTPVTTTTGSQVLLPNQQRIATLITETLP